MSSAILSKKVKDRLRNLGYTVFNRMLKINPDMEISHEEMDFVVENFTDECESRSKRDLTQVELAYLVRYFDRRRYNPMQYRIKKPGL